MFGFLNVFLTAAAMMQGAGDRDAVQMLNERGSAAIAASDDAVRWGKIRFDASTLERLRDEVAVSFGSCSFAEPLEGLRALALLSPR
jgi:deoxyhypusine synthase